MLTSDIGGEFAAYGPGITDSCLFFLYALAAGWVFGLLYEPLRVIRRVFSHNSIILTAAEDFIYCVVCTAVYICLVYCANFGDLRGFALLGTGLGIYAYFQTLGKLFSRLFPQRKKADGKSRVAAKPKKEKNHEK